MRFPWQKEKTEVRSSTYESRLIEAIHAAASAEDASLSSTSHLQAISNLLARSLAGAQVNPVNSRTAAITPSYLYSVGQSIVQRGDHVALIEVADGLNLRPASSWDIKGSSLEQAKWRYRLTFNVPDGQQKRRVFGNEVVHIRLPDSERPWQPGSPIGGLTASATAEVEAAIETEARQAARGKMVHVPGFEDSDQSEDDPWVIFQQDVRKADGKTMLAPAPAGIVQGIASASSPPQFGTLRLRPEFDEELIELRSQLGQSIASTLSILPGLLTGGDSTGQREAQRFFHNVVLIPLGQLIETEIGQALDTDISLDFTRLQLGNLRERASVLKMLTDAGVEKSEALKLAGLG